MHHIDRGKPTQMSAEFFNLSYMDQVRHINHGPPWEEIWQAMEQLVAAGKILYVGSSNFAAWNIAQANTLAVARHFLGLVSEQSKYNLAMRTTELEVIPVCRAMGLGLVPWSPLDGGLLAGMSGNATEGRRTKLPPETLSRHREQLNAYEGLCHELGHSPANVALAWLLHNPVVTAPIIGPRTMEQLTGSLKALEVEFSAEILARLDEIWPGPGGQAPEAYTW